MAGIETGTVQKINLKDDDVNEVYSIEVVTRSSSMAFVVVYPLDTNIKRIPIVGEQVIIPVSYTHLTLPTIYSV